MSETWKELLEKVVSVTGIFYPITSTVKAIADSKISKIMLEQEYDEKYKREILDNAVMDDYTKAVLISNLSKSTIKFANQAKILNVSLDKVSDTAKPENIDNDWLLSFMHEAAYISNEQMQYVWGCILAEACDNPDFCSKTLLNTLSLMNRKQAEWFNGICKFRLVNMDISPQNNDVISVYPVIFFSKGAEGYGTQGLTNRGILELQHLGLIDVDSKKEFVVYRDHLRLRDSKNSVEVIGKGKVEIGNIVFTYDGFLLQKIIEDYYDNQIMDYNIRIWCGKGYQVYLNGKWVQW